MKTWNIPVMQELDVRLTASGAFESTSEKDNGQLTSDGYVYPTYVKDTKEWNSNINDTGVDDGCVSEIKNS